MKKQIFMDMQKAEKTNTVIVIIVRILLVLVSFISFIVAEYVNILMCLFIYVLTIMPMYVSQKINLKLTWEFNITITLFIFASMFLGEIFNFYELIPWWDIMLHGLSGVLIGAFGFSLVYIMNKTDRVKMTLSPLFISLFAFCFSMTIAVIWEIIEFIADNLFGLNMQKSGLVDTMWDFIVCFIGTFIAAVGGYVHVKFRKHITLYEGVDKFIEVNMSDDEDADIA